MGRLVSVDAKKRTVGELAEERGEDRQQGKEDGVKWKGRG